MFGSLFLRRRAAAYRTALRLLCAAVVALLVGVVVPNIVVGRSIQLPTDRTFHAVATAPEGYTLAGASALRAERTTRTAPVDPAALADAAPKSTAAVNSELRLFASDLLAASTDTAILNRESTYPEAFAPNSWRLEVSGKDFQVDDTARDGLQYFFPADTEKRSYPYFDALTQDSFPIDYVGKEKLGELDAFHFRQDIAARPLTPEVAAVVVASVNAQDARDPQRLVGPAEHYFTAQEREHFRLKEGTTVVLHPYYGVSRDVWVDPATGTILNVEEDVRLLYATDPAQANDTAAGAPSQRALLVGHFAWDADTRAAALALAHPTVRLHKIMGAVSWASKALAALLLACAAVSYLRRRSPGEAHA